MKIRPFILIHSLLFLLITIFSIQPWPSLMLTIAQILYVPILLQFISTRHDCGLTSDIIILQFQRMRLWPSYNGQTKRHGMVG